MIRAATVPCPVPVPVPVLPGKVPFPSLPPGTAFCFPGYAYVLRIESGYYSVTESEEKIPAKEGEPEKTEKKYTAKWLGSFALGERLEVVGPVIRATYSNRDYDMVEVRRDTGDRYYILNAHLGYNGQLAVVTDEKAILYTTPKNVDATGNILPIKTVFIIQQNTESQGFVKITAYDPVAQIYRRDMYLKTICYSTRDTDIQSSILLQTAAITKEAIRKNALLDSALQEYPDSVFSNEIAELVNPVPQPAGADQRTDLPARK
uniref:Uncharacterized protein n=1 Tax=Breznakiella homolactica TaxID=2798577 RepID=A0A7T8BAT4_9SPIR